MGSTLANRGGLALLLTLSVALTTTASADDWPTYRHDNARSGITTESLQLPLSLQWVFRSPYAPEPAWGDPKPDPVEGYQELRRIHFDDAHQVVAGDDRVFFGTSADGKVHCLDGNSGQVRWSYYTGCPIRLAPTLHDGRLYFGSDNGIAHCLNADDGSVAWTFSVAPESKRVLGHGRMISLWPIRSGILVDDGIAYVTGGIFPAEGVFLYALDAKTGKEVWRNDTCGEDPQSRISPQGYMLASGTTLYAPMGRVSPAAFDRKTGTLKFLTSFGKAVGGTYALLVGDDVYTGTEQMVGFHGTTRDRFAAFWGHKLVVAENTAFVAEDTKLAALNRKKFPVASMRLETLKNQKTTIDRNLASNPSDKNKALALQIVADIESAEKQFAATRTWETDSTCHESLILAGGTLYAGGENQVTAVDSESGKVVWQTDVEGTVKGLAVADGRLLATTNSGLIYAFAPGSRDKAAEITVERMDDVFKDTPHREALGQAAEEIAKRAGSNQGFCLIVGLETGQLAVDLARQTELLVYAVDEDPAVVERVRQAVDKTGLLGGRVSVECWPINEIPYADYFANLLVSESVLVGETLSEEDMIDPDQLLRMLKPVGGRVLARFPEQAAGSADMFGQWLQGSQVGPQLTVSSEDGWLQVVRGAIPGAGTWTHLYANPGNSACGDDRAVTTPLGVLWFGHPGPGDMVNRHRRAASPLAIDGRLLVQGENVLMAYDMYNGLKLWERRLQGAMRVNASHDGTNLTVNKAGFFVAIGNRCLQLDPATGETITEHPLPPEKSNAKRRWGYTACTEELLYGSRVSGTYVSDRVFAIDFRQGKPQWTYEGKRISNNAIAIGDGNLYLIDANVTAQDREIVIEASRERIAALPPEERAAAEKALEKPDVRMLVALDATTGEVRFKQPIDVTHCGGGTLSLIQANGSLVVFGVYLDGHYWKEFFAGDFDARRVAVFDAKNGSFQWSRAVSYRVRPIVIGDTLHTEPWAWDLATGEPRTRVNPITGQEDRWQFARAGHHCGLPIGSPNCLFFRSLNLGYYDLNRDDGTMHFGAQRPGCWINFIPAGGLVLMPEASAGCMCPFPNMCSVAFQPTAQSKAYTHYSTAGMTTPVRELSLNLGAAGDRSDDQGTLWLSLPRPFKGRLVLDLDTEQSFHRGGGFVRRNSSYTPIEGSKSPWLFTSAARGLRKMRIPLLGEADGTALYRVRLGFCDPDNSEPGKRVFDVKLQGKTVLEGFDPVAESGGRDRVVFQEFEGVEVSDDLIIELAANTGSPSPEQAPILQTIEVSRGAVTRLGCAVSDVLLSNATPTKTTELTLANIRDNGFEGRLSFVTPKGLTVQSDMTEVALASGGRTVIPVEVSAAKDLAAGEYELGAMLTGVDGKVELERVIPVEHLGRRERLVVEATADACVQAAHPDLGKGNMTVLLVDGGASKMEDEHHTLALFRFPLGVPGKVVRARFRIQAADNPSSDAGRICLVDGPWKEMDVTYRSRPGIGREVAKLGPVAANEVVERDLDVDLSGMKQVNFVMDPTSCDGIYYSSRESGTPAQLILDYEPNNAGRN
jgi:outer membrane protein assembly factor BamB